MTPLEPDSYYHIFNRANGNEKIFRSSNNYNFFLRKYTKHIVPISDTFCYCLMPNHFHFLIRIKNESEIVNLPNYRPNQAIHIFLSKQFSNLFSSYTQAFNKQMGRKGSLFMRPFKRKPVKDESYLRKLTHYIHHNPIEAGLCKTPENWKYSSFNTLISNKPTLLKREEVIRNFDELDNFLSIHTTPPNLSGI